MPSASQARGAFKWAASQLRSESRTITVRSLCTATRSRNSGQMVELHRNLQRQTLLSSSGPVPSLYRKNPQANDLSTPTLVTIRTLKSIAPVRRNKYNNDPNRPPLGSSRAAALQRKLKANVLPLRTGALATKIGMTAIYDPETGERQACTVLQLDRNQVVGLKTRRQYGYWAVVIGAGAKAGSNANRAEKGVFAKAGVGIKRHVAEFRVDGRPSEALGVGGIGKDENEMDIVLGGVRVGDSVNADWFHVGQFVDTRSNTKGKGFAGVMKRHGMSGQPASHGQSLTHRTLGSAGGGQGSGSRVHPGKRMAGRMGNERHTIQNLRILQVDAENGIVVVNGCVSGPKGCVIQVQDAKKKDFPEPEPLPSRVEVEATLLEGSGSAAPTELLR